MIDLRKAAEMALDALEKGTTGLAIRAIPALRQALAQPEPIKRVCNTCNGTGIVKDLHNFATGGKREQPCWNCHEMAVEEKWSTLGDADHRLLLGKSNNFTKETENRLCDIERRLATIETQPALAQPDTAPPSKPLIALTDEQIADVWANSKRDVFDFVIPFARAIEAKLGEKNYG